MTIYPAFEIGERRKHPVQTKDGKRFLKTVEIRGYNIFVTVSRVLIKYHCEILKWDSEYGAYDIEDTKWLKEEEIL